MDSSWRYASLKSAIIKLFCYRVVLRTGEGYCKLPPHIASKKACINPNCESGCFWWSIKIALILNREGKIDYKKKARRNSQRTPRSFENAHKISNNLEHKEKV